MNDKQIEEIKKEIDSLIQEASNNNEALSDEFSDELEGIASDIEEVKEKKKTERGERLNEKLDTLIRVATKSGELSSVTTKQIVDAIQKIKIDTVAPQVNVSPPKVEVAVPPIKIPPIIVPEVKIPPTQVSFPKDINIKKPSWINGLFPIKSILDRLDAIKKSIVLPWSADDPISVRLSDGEKFYRALGGGSGSASIPSFKNSAGEVKQALVDGDSHAQVDVLTIPDVTVTGVSTSAKQDTILAELQLKANLTETQPVSLASVPSHAVTNAGTFAVQSTLQTGTSAIGRVGHDITGVGHGVKTVTTAGTDEAIAGSTACKKVDLQAQTDNTGLIAVGASGVDATVATGTGIILNPGEVYSLEIDNLADIFIDSTVSGDGVRFSYYS